MQLPCGMKVINMPCCAIVLQFGVIAAERARIIGRQSLGIAVHTQTLVALTSELNNQTSFSSELIG